MHALIYFVRVPFSEMQKKKTKRKSRRPRKLGTEWVLYSFGFWFLPHFKYQPLKSRLGKEKGFPHGVPRDGSGYRQSWT